MSLEVQVRQIINNFEDTAPDTLFKVLQLITLQFRTSLTLEYLEGKIQKIQNISNNDEKKKQCKTLLPYLDWYLQGL